ncbi:hypothetical protein BV898_12443 [Hypsibius exemplaris]|uniref:WW domain-binding protein 4 n=1 Tax=Hypsibius exemplaris TaxID=2072580 RepID=A0A1W0WDT8_HYPEX|nr:hypothetical protein BV898_12443 [Hypsibius exemplaris]
MTEYWKSIPKKFCDACKCWFQDNKASIDFHERGTRHKQNMEQKIRDSQSKGKTNLDARSAVDIDMQKIEAAAMAAFAKDMATNPSLVKSYGAMPTLSKATAKPGESSKTASLLESLPVVASTSASTSTSRLTEMKLENSQAKALEAITVKQKKQLLAAAAQKWKEAKSEDGYSYFYNTEIGESRWDAPPEGYISLADQQEANPTDTAEGESEKSVPALRTKPLLPALGATGSIGKWTTVTPEEVSTTPNLGLIPASRSAASQLSDEMHNTAAEHEVNRIQFKTKTVTSFGAADDQDMGFKKRKFGGDAKRQVRKRED